MNSTHTWWVNRGSPPVTRMRDAERVARRLTRREWERGHWTRRDERERYEDNKDVMPGTLRPGLTRRYERARESEVVKGHRKRGE